MHYQSNYLTNVILRLDFEPIQALHDGVNVDSKPEFSARIRATYPLVVGQPMARVSVSVGPGTSGISQKVTGIQWHHKKEETGTKVIVLSHDFLSIEYGHTDYDHFPPFLEEVTGALQALRDLYQVPLFKRIGLRYVNEIVLPEGNPLEWTGIIAPNLITAVLAGKEADASIVRSMHQLHTRLGQTDLVSNYGLHNSEFPNTVTRRAFVLDYDASQGGVDAVDAIRVIELLNSRCEQAFEASIERDLRERLRPI